MGPEGGRPQVPYRAVIKVLWYALVIGCRSEDVPLELDCLPAVAGLPLAPSKRSRPRSHPDVLFANRGYDSEVTRDALRAQGIKPVIARRGEDHRSSLGRIRWVVERMVSRFNGFRCIRVRYHRLIPIQHARNEIASAIIYFRIVLRRGISHGQVSSGPFWYRRAELRSLERWKRTFVYSIWQEQKHDSTLDCRPNACPRRRLPVLKLASGLSAQVLIKRVNGCATHPFADRCSVMASCMSEWPKRMTRTPSCVLT